MASYELHPTLVAIAIGVAMAFPAAAAPEAPPLAADHEPAIVAQSTVPVNEAREAVVAGEEFPAYQRGVRTAAAAGPDALRRYIWRTRMFHNFNYNDFAPKQ